MTVPNPQSKWGPYFGNNVTTRFSYGGRIFEASDLIVKKTTLATSEVATVPSNTYSVTNIGNVNGGEVIFPTALPVGFSIMIRRALPLVQETDVINQGAFHAQIHEDVFDYLMMVDQQMRDSVPIFEDPVASHYLRYKDDLTIESTGVTSFGPMTAALSTGRITFADSGESINTDAALLWNNTTKKMVIGSSGVFNTITRDAAAVFMQRSVADEAAGILNFGLVIQHNVAAGTATQNSWRGAIMAQVVTFLDASTFAADTSGMASQAIIGAGNTNGRVAGFVAEASSDISGTADGLMIGVEASVINQGSFTANEDLLKPKINLWLSTHQAPPYNLHWNKITSAIAMSNTPGAWQYGWLMRNICAVYLSMRLPSDPGAIGIDMKNHANWGQAMVCPNGKPIAFYDASGLVTHNVLNMGATNSIAIGQDTGINEIALFAGTTERIRVNSLGIGFYGSAPVTKPNVTGSRGGNAALASVIGVLNTLGLVNDSSTP